MANIARVRCVWSGFPGGPGVSTHYLDPGFAAGSLGVIRTFYNGLISYLPNTISIQVPGSGDILDDANGELVSQWTDTTPAVCVGTSASGYAAPAGMIVQWKTATIVDGNRLVGKTYIVPMANVFEPGGTPTSAVVTSVGTLALSMVTGLAGDLLVWHRPIKANPEADPPVVGRLGSSAPVTTVSVPDRAAVLRSRRD